MKTVDDKGISDGHDCKIMREGMTTLTTQNRQLMFSQRKRSVWDYHNKATQS